MNQQHRQHKVESMSTSVSNDWLLELLNNKIDSLPQQLSQLNQKMTKEIKAHIEKTVDEKIKSFETRMNKKIADTLSTQHNITKQVMDDVTKQVNQTVEDAIKTLSNDITPQNEASISICPEKIFVKPYIE